MTTQLAAGAARCDITPPIGIAHGNWSAQIHERAEGIDLPLFCTALAVADRDEEVIIVECDLISPPEGERLAEVRGRITDLTGVPASHIRISSSHTHSGPSLGRPWFDAGAEMVGPYLASLPDRIAGACLGAHQSLRPAWLAGGRGVCDVNANRRKPWKPGCPLMAPNPEGFSDHEVGVIRIDDDHGQPIAVLVHFAAHPTILAWDNRLISPDYPGTIRRTVESLAGGLCLFLQGAAGNQDTVRDFSCRVSDARWVGRQIGLEAARVVETIETRPVQPRIDRHVESSWTMGVVERVPGAALPARVHAISRVVPLPLWHREPPTEAELRHLEELKSDLHRLRRDGAPPEQIREANRLTRRATLDLNMARQRSQGTHMPVEFQAIRLGPAALIGIPAEPFAEIGVEVKKRSPFATTFFSGYTNGVTAYLPTPEAYQEGGYEVWITSYAPETANIVVEQSAALLADLAD